MKEQFKTNERYSEGILALGGLSGDFETACRLAGLGPRRKNESDLTLTFDAIPLNLRIIGASDGVRVMNILMAGENKKQFGSMIIGSDFLEENGCKPSWVIPLDELVPNRRRSKVELFYTPNLLRRINNPTLENFSGGVIAGPFPNLLLSYLSQKGIKDVQTFYVKNKTEIFGEIFDDIDGIIDDTETRKTALTQQLQWAATVRSLIVACFVEFPTANSQDKLRYNDFQEKFYSTPFMDASLYKLLNGSYRNG